MLTQLFEDFLAQDSDNADALGAYDLADPFLRDQRDAGKTDEELEQIVEDVATNDFPDSDHIYTNLRDLLLEEGEGREHEQREERLAYVVKILEKLQENGSDITAETNVNTVEKFPKLISPNPNKFPTSMIFSSVKTIISITTND